jgi:predicted transposase YdaD
MKKKKIIPKVTKDELWKGIIEDLFEDFLHFFFPKFVHEVDFTKPFVFLDKELQELIPDSESRNRRADVLVKVFLKSGEEKWILIHTEVQGYVDEYFQQRMYIYNYRTYDRFNQEVVGLAILTDENPNFHPMYYERETWGTKIRYDFQMFKILDYDEAYYKKFDNPFASVMLVARSFLRNKSLKTDEDLLSLKLQLFRTMYEKGHNKEIIRKIANFIKLYVSFKNDNYFIKFETELDKITKYQPTMGLLELIKQRTIEAAKEEGLEEGREKGLEQGLEKGLEQGLEKGLEQGLEKGLEQGLEKGLEQGLEKGLEQGLEKLKEERRKAITNMLAKIFTVEVIAGILEIPILEVQMVEQEGVIKTLFQAGLTIETLKEQFEENEQTIFISDNQLEILFQEVQVELLLTEGLTIEAIMKKLEVSENFVVKIQKIYK